MFIPLPSTITITNQSPEVKLILHDVVAGLGDYGFFGLEPLYILKGSLYQLTCLLVLEIQHCLWSATYIVFY